MEEPPDKVNFKLRNILNWTISWPVLLLVHMLLLLVLLSFLFHIADFGCVYLQVGLILSSLFHYTLLCYENGGKEVQLNGWKILLIPLMAGSILIAPLLYQSTEESFVWLIFATVFFAGHVWWIVPRIKHMILTRTDFEGQLLATIGTTMVLMLALCLIRLGAISLNLPEEPFFIRVGLFLSLVIVLYVMLRLMIFYLHRSNPDPDFMDSDKKMMFPDETSNGLLDRHELLVAVLKIEQEFELKEIFLHKNFSLDMLAEKTQISRHKLTYVFNQYYRKGFYRFVGEYRIRYAMKILDENQSLSLDALSDRCGFNSKSSFYKYFKRVNGCTPQQFMFNRDQRKIAVS